MDGTNPEPGDAVVTTPKENDNNNTTERDDFGLVDSPPMSHSEGFGSISLVAGEIANEISADSIDETADKKADDETHDRTSNHSNADKLAKGIAQDIMVESKGVEMAQSMDVSDGSVSAAQTFEPLSPPATTTSLSIEGGLDRIATINRRASENPWDQKYIRERQPEIARQKQRFELCTNGRVVCLIFVIVVVAALELAKLNSGENTTTQTEYIEYEELDFPYVVLFFYEDIMDCSAIEVEYFDTSKSFDKIVTVENLTNFVYDESVDYWVQLVGPPAENYATFASGIMILPPYKLTLEVNDYLAVHTSCTTINIGHEDPLGCCQDYSNDTDYLNFNHSLSRRSPYWVDLLYLRMSHWLYFSRIIGHVDELFGPTKVDYGLCDDGLNGCIANAAFERLTNADRNYGFTSMGSISGTTIQMIEVNDYTTSPRIKRKVYSQQPSLDIAYSEKIDYNESGWTENPGSYWKVRGEQWYVTDVSAMKLRVTTRYSKSMFEAFSELGGFFSIINRISRWVVTLAVLGVSINVAWLGLHINVKGVAYDAPLDEDTERRINLLLQRRRMVTEHNLREILNDFKDEIRKELRQEIRDEILGSQKTPLIK